MHTSMRTNFLWIRLPILQLIISCSLAVDRSSMGSHVMPTTSAAQLDLYDGFPTRQQCVDVDGMVIEDGRSFTPSDDPCKTCHCQRGSFMCVSVQCSPPACKYRQILGECCKFVCIPGSEFIVPADNNNTDLGVRVIATAITSLLILLLLIFMIHRLHRRHVQIANRRMNIDRDGNAEDDELAVYVTNIDHIDHPFPYPYQDPPPPYTPRKSSAELNEAPPPYQPSTNGNVGNVAEPDVAGGNANNSTQRQSMPRSSEPECAAVDSTTPADDCKTDIVIAYGSEFGVFCVDDISVRCDRPVSATHKNISNKLRQKKDILFGNGRRFCNNNHKCERSSSNLDGQIHRSDYNTNGVYTSSGLNGFSIADQKLWLNREQEILLGHQIAATISDISDAEQDLMCSDCRSNKNVILFSNNSSSTVNLENMEWQQKTASLNQRNMKNEMIDVKDITHLLVAKLSNNMKQDQNYNVILEA